MRCRKNNTLAAAVSLFLATWFLLAAAGLQAEPVLNINKKTDHYLLANVLQYFVDDTADKKHNTDEIFLAR